MSAVAPTLTEASAEAPIKPAGFVRRLIRDKPLGAAGGLIFLLFLFCGIFADVLAPYGMNEINPIDRLKPPSWAHPFGTDNLGRDMLSRRVRKCRWASKISS
jgi:peptide/nickel transport system permease protein